MTSHRTPPAAHRGFTLTELSIVLVIVGLLIGGMLVPLSAQREVQNAIETQKQLDEIKEALFGFAVLNRRLPRPATSLADGTENPVPCPNDAACTGFVPWTTLGVRKSDAWNKLIVYSVTPAYAQGVVSLATVGNRTVKTRDKNGATSDLITNAAVVLYSAGKNNWGTTEDGVVLAGGSAANADENANAAATVTFIARGPSTVTGGGEFDDIVVWISPNILCSRLLAAGRLP